MRHTTFLLYPPDDYTGFRQAISFSSSHLQEHEGFESSRLVSTLLAREHALELPREQRYHDRELPSEMVAPPNVRQLSIGPTVAVRLLDVRLVRDAVEIFVQTVQQKRQQFLPRNQKASQVSQVSQEG